MWQSGSRSSKKKLREEKNRTHKSITRGKNETRVRVTRAGVGSGVGVGGEAGGRLGGVVRILL